MNGRRSDIYLHRGVETVKNYLVDRSKSYIYTGGVETAKKKLLVDEQVNGHNVLVQRKFYWSETKD